MNYLVWLNAIKLPKNCKQYIIHKIFTSNKITQITKDWIHFNKIAQITKNLTSHRYISNHNFTVPHRDSKWFESLHKIYYLPTVLVIKIHQQHSYKLNFPYLPLTTFDKRMYNSVSSFHTVYVHLLLYDTRTRTSFEVIFK